MRITKTIAESIAKKMTKGFEDKIDKLKSNRKIFLRKFLLDLVPKEILTIYKEDKHKKFIQDSRYVHFMNEGEFIFSSKFEEIPLEQQVVNIDKKIATKINNFKRDINSLKNQKSDIQNEIQGALLGLRTFNRVIVEFPEAAEYLPEQTGGALAVNVEGLREKLKQTEVI